MKISRSILLICISFLLLIPSGCYMSKYKDGGKVEFSGAEYQELRAFPPGFKKALFRADLSVNGHEFEGLVMIKAFEDKSYKVAFFSELGLNFFDFELRQLNPKNKLNLFVNNIYDPLDKNILLNSLEKYFSMLLSPGLDEGVHKTFLKEDGSRVMVRLKSYKGKDAYLSKNLIEPYLEIVNIGSLRGHERITITLSERKKNFSPESILIEHPGLRMRFSLELIQ
jgi:hypothetical protein